jgi:putative endopeptidase
MEQHMTSRFTPRFWRLCMVMALLVAVAFAQQPTPNEPQHGLDPANLDRSTKPSQDFYQFANGGWLARNPVPPEYSRYGSFEELMEKNYRDLHKILDEAAENTSAPKGSNLQKVGDYYASAMDSAQAEKLGVTPLAGEFEQIASLNTTSDLPALLARRHVHGIPGLFNFFVEQDAKASTNVIAQLYQGGLGLPDRDYYTKDDDRSKMIRDEYVKHVTKMFELLGDATAADEAKTVMEMETELAKASMTRVEQRNPNAIYHKTSLSDLAELTPAFSWDAYFRGIGWTNPGSLNVCQPEFFKAMNRMIANRPVTDWKTYLRWHLIRATAPLLSSPFVNESFHFYGSVMTGAKELRPRWKRALSSVNEGLGEALGMLYVKEFFTPKAKARALEMVNNLKAAFEGRIETRQWMSEATRVKALAKLDAFGVKIGYPDKWRSYAGLEIDRGPYVWNAMRADSFEFKRQLAKIGQPVDRTEWGMTPPTVNAYYNPLMNEIVFPAGILQPPFFDPNADDAVNYGGMGAVIGHEMTHGFDDQGSQYDAKGNLADWWKPQDKNAFAARTKLVEEEFDGFVAVDSLHVNGKLTLGENIADLGGLTIAYAALKKSMEGKPEPPTIDGFTPEQRFFLAWAQMWRANYRPEELRRRLIIDVHSPSKFRTNGPIMNMPEFYEAFSVAPGDSMYRPEKERARIW